MSLPYIDLGPCAFCGDPDAGHRVRDSMAERFHAGESLTSIAEDYGVTEAVAQTLIEMLDRENVK